MAYNLLPHLSWKKSEQTLLAREYLKGIPFASAKPYEAFLSFMPVRKMLAVLVEFIPANEKDRDLLFYYLLPLLSRATKTDADHQALKAFARKFNVQI